MFNFEIYSYMYLEISLSNLDSPYDNSEQIADAYNEFESKLIMYDSFSLLKFGLTYLLFAFLRNNI